MIPTLQKKYDEVIVPALMEELDVKTTIQVPKLSKVTLNMGVGEAINDRKVLDNAVENMMSIAGQKPIITYARKSEAAFKIRAGWAIGCKVTLRRAKMYEFVDRLIGIALPRTRDFRGLSPRAFDGRGNYSLGITEQIIFPEIDYDKIDKIRGMNVTITTTARDDEQGLALLRSFDFPFRS